MRSVVLTVHHLATERAWEWAIIDFQAKDKSKKKKKKKEKRKTESKEGYLEAEGLSTPSKENLPPVKAATPTNNKLPVCKFRP